MKNKRMQRMFICLCLAVCLMTVSAAPAYADNGRAIQAGTSAVSDGDAVYYGNAGTQWRVLDADATNTGAAGMFLLMENPTGNVVFEAAWNSDDGDGQTNPNDWQKSDAQAWCTGYAAANFSGIELGAMPYVSKTDAEATLYGIPWGSSSLNGERMFFLSAQEAATYLGDYDRAPGLQSSGVWWLRSPYADDVDDAGLVFDDGYVYYFNVDLILSARPAFNVNLNSVLFTSAAAGGKSSGAGSAGKIFEIPASSTTGWKLTLLDSSRGFSAQCTGRSGDTLSISYSGAATGSNEYISAIVSDGSGYTHYGQLAASNGSGTVRLDLNGVDMSGKKLYIFSEQVNGDKMTDYASAMVQVEIPSNNPYGVPSTGSHRDTGLMVTLALVSGSVLLLSLRRRKEA